MTPPAPTGDATEAPRGLFGWRMGLRGQLFVTSLLLIVVIGALAGTLLGGWLDAWADSRLEAELRAHARSVAAAASLVEPNDDFARTFSAATGTNIAVYDASGTLLDSSELPDASAAWAPARNLDGIAQAADGTVRRAEAAGHRVLYVLQPAGNGRVVRVGLLADPAWSRRVVWFVVVASLVGLGVAILMSGLASALAARELRGLVVNATHLARGERQRVPRGSGPEIAQLAGSFNRLSEQLETAVTALASSRHRLETILSSLNEALLVVDDERRLTLLNDAARDLFGIEGEVVGQALVQVVRNPALHVLLDRREDNPANTGHQPVDARAGRSPGAEPELIEFELSVGKRRRLVQVRARPLRQGGGLLIVALDVTDVRRLETIRKDFVANVSHELRTPVAVIRANAETLASGGLADGRRAQGFVDAIHRNAERLSSLLADLLDLSRIESGRWAVATEPVPLLGVARRAAAALQSVAETRGSAVAVRVPPDLQALGDARAVEQVLANLLENALKHSPEGCSVELGAQRSGDRVRIWVEDDGPGIDAAHRARVFERFYRVDPGRSRAVGGTGLGLAIVRHLAETMGGSCGLEPRTPRGSRFWLELPATAG